MIVKLISYTDSFFIQSNLEFFTSKGVRIFSSKALLWLVDRSNL